MQRGYLIFTGLIFLAMCLAHVSRVAAGWDVVIMGWVVPHWVSIPGAIVTGLLSLWGFSLASRAGRRRKYHM